jgi:curved DNA-binding protein CbpA
MSRESGRDGYQEKAEYSGQNYYEILGVPVRATEDEIKTAFRTLSKQHHPDLGGSESKFKYITEAYNTLKDAKLRLVYDLDNSIRRPKTEDRERSTGDHSSDHTNKQHDYRTTWGKSESKREATGSDPFEESKRQAEERRKAREKLKAELEAELKRMREELNNLRTERPKPYEQPRKTESNYTRNRAESYGGFHIEKKGISTYLVDKNGRSISRGFNKIEQLGDMFVGENVAGFKYLLSPQTGKEIGRSFNKFRIERGKVIGENSIGSQYLIDRNSGRELGRSYSKIHFKGDLLVGKSYSGEYLLDPENGKDLSRSFQEIISRDDLAIGKSFTGEYLLDKKTGKELTSSYQKIERRGNQIIGKTYTREEVIKI